MRASSSAPFCGNGKFISWNARALFCLEPGQLHRKLCLLRRLAAEADVVMVQEAHANDEKWAIFDLEVHTSHVTYWSNAADGATLGGVGFVVRRAFLEQFASYSFVDIVPARAALLSLRGPSGALDLCCLHVNPVLNVAGKRRFLSTVRRSLSEGVGVHTLVCGDFNFDSSVTDRIDCRTGRFCGTPGPEQQCFDDLFAGYAELNCQDFIHRIVRQDAVAAVSRIDRAYTSLHAAYCDSMVFSASVFQPISAPNFDVSDHVPLMLSFGAAPPPRRGAIPSWVTRHPLWPGTVSEVLATFHIDTLPDLNDRMRIIKVAMRLACKRVVDAARHHHARNADEELWWLLRALRALRLGRPHVLDQCAAACPSLPTLLDTPPGDLSRLLDRIAELSRKSASDKLQEVQRNSSLPEYARKQQTSRMARLVRTWASTRRYVRLQGVRREDGSFVDDPGFHRRCRSLGAGFWREGG